jgi:hypothetical protein
MPGRTREDDPDDWDEDEDELPEGVYYDDEIPTVPCPYCRAEISEEAQWCPRCENYLSREDAPPAGSRRSAFWIVAMILALGAAVWWVLR